MNPDLLAGLVHERISDLRREASAVALSRAAGRRSPSRMRPAWPASVAAALRDTVAHATSWPGSRPARRGAPCPTC